MKQKYRILILLLFVLSLTGCAATEGFFGDVLSKMAGLTNDEDYKRYEQLVEQEALDQDGYYQGEMSSVEIDESTFGSDGSIPVSFARNSYLHVDYYLDAEMTQELSQSQCKLNPGESVYAVAVPENPNSSLYQLSEFRVRVYDTDGVVLQEDVIPATENHLVYQIPEEFNAASLGIAPIGAYTDRKISMNTYYLDEEGKRCPVYTGGNWEINGTPCTGEQAFISPVEPFVLKYNFDQDNFFYVSSQPQCFTPDPNSTGCVEFWEADPSDQETEYSIELHHNLWLDLECTAAASVKLNDGEAETLEKNKTWSNHKLKYGDVILVETDGLLSAPQGDVDSYNLVSDAISGEKRRYRLSIVPASERDTGKGNNTGLVDLTLDSECRYGECVFKLGREKVSGRFTCHVGDKLKISYEITDSDYQFDDQEGGLLGFVNGIKDRVLHPQQETTVTITAEMDGTTVHADDYFHIIRKEGLENG